MTRFSWLHLSDFHCSTTDQGKCDNTITQLGKFLSDTILTEKNVDYVFLTGDVGNIGVVAGTSTPFNIISRRIADKNIFWAPGNHDIHRSDQRRKVVQNLRLGKWGNCKKPERNRNDAFEKNMADREYKQTLFFDVPEASSFSCITTDRNKTIACLELDHVNLVILNTSLCSLDKQDPGNLFVVDRSSAHEMAVFFDKIRDVANGIVRKPTFIIAHHSKAFLAPEQQNRLENVVRNNVDLYLCGHSHVPGYDYFDIPVDCVNNRNKHNKPTYQITSGCITSEDIDPKFYYGEYDQGSISVTPYLFDRKKEVWRESNDDTLDRVPLPRFRQRINHQIRSKKFVLFITGSQATGKTTIARQLAKTQFGGEVFQIFEVDFLLEALRESLRLAGKGDHILCESSYTITSQQLLEQNAYIAPRLWAVCKKQLEKSIPLIVEGLNIDVKAMIECVNVMKKDQEHETIEALFVNIQIDTDDLHTARLTKRMDERHLSMQERTKQTNAFEKIRENNSKYYEQFNELTILYPNHHFIVVRNVDNDNYFQVVNKIIESINSI